MGGGGAGKALVDILCTETKAPSILFRKPATLAEAIPFIPFGRSGTFAPGMGMSALSQTASKQSSLVMGEIL